MSMWNHRVLLHYSYAIYYANNILITGENHLPDTVGSAIHGTRFQSGTSSSSARDQKSGNKSAQVYFLFGPTQNCLHLIVGFLSTWVYGVCLEQKVLSERRNLC